MKRRFKKFSTLLLSTCIIFQFTACSSNNSSTNVSNVAGNTEVTNNTEDGAATPEEVTMKVGYAYDSSFVYQGSESIDDNTWTQLYKEHGINLQIMYNVELSQRYEKQAQVIMSGDYPDFLTVGNAYYKDYAEQGVFMDLMDYYEEYASDLTKEFYNTQYGQDALASAMVDGKLYALPVVSSGYDGLPVLWIRQDWLNNLSLQAPETIDEFYELARAFTEDDPDGDGVNNTYGLAVNGKDVFNEKGGINEIFQMFGVNPGTSGGSIPFIESDGKAVYGGALEEESMEALTLIKNMYDNGYIAKDFVTTGGEQIDQNLSAGKTGMIIGRMWIMGTPWDNLLATVPEAEWVAVSLPGVTTDDNGSAYYTAVPGDYYALSSKSENVEEYFTIINLGIQYLAQPDTLSQEDYEKYNGLAGTYTGWQAALCSFGDPIKNLNALTMHQTALETGDTSALNAENLRDYNSMLDYINNKDKRDELDETRLAQSKSGLFYYSVWGAEKCSYAAINDMIENDNLLYSAYEIAPTNNMVEYSTTLDTLAKETIIEIIMGNKEVSYYSEFLKTWNSLGGDVITGEADEWFQSTK